VALAGVDVAFLGRDALIRNKRAAGREQDLADAARLERLRSRPDGGKSASPRAPGPRRGPPERA